MSKQSKKEEKTESALEGAPEVAAKRGARPPVVLARYRYVGPRMSTSIRSNLYQLADGGEYELPVCAYTDGLVERGALVKLESEKAPPPKAATATSADAEKLLYVNGSGADAAARPAAQPGPEPKGSGNAGSEKKG